TAGSWKQVYGAQGADVIGDASTLPASTVLTPPGNNVLTWSSSTADTRALLKTASGASSSDRVAAAWSDPASFTVGLNLTDGKQHRVALYVDDWDSKGRA